MPDVAAFLARERVLDDEGLARALHGAHDGDVASAAFELGLAPEASIVRALCHAHGCPGVDLSSSVVPASNLLLVPAPRCRSLGVLPVSIGRGEVVLAMADPGNAVALNEVRLMTGRRVLPHVAVRGAIERVLTTLMGPPRRAAWRGERAPALPDATAAWVGVVKPFAAASGIDLPEVEEEMQLVGLADEIDEGSPASPGSRSPSAVAARAPPPRAAQSPRSNAAAPSPVRAAPSPTPPPETLRPVALAEAGAAAPETAGDPSDAAPRGASIGAAPRVGGRKLAVVADDDPETRKLLDLVLASIGCDVVEAADGEEALELTAARRPDLVVLDAMMPRLHGFEACQRIKADPALRATAVVLCSAIYRGAVAADAKAAFGADAYLEKPFRLEKAGEMLRAALAGACGPAGADPVARETAERSSRAAARALRDHRDEEALEFARQAVAQDGTSPEAHYYLGHALSRGGLLFEAAAEFERAAELQPDADRVYQCLALTYERIGLQRSARQAWAHAIAACRDSQRRRVMQERLNRLLFL